MTERRTLEEALEIWNLDELRLEMAVEYFRIALRLPATELQAVIVALREVALPWKNIADGLNNSRRICQRRRSELLDKLEIDETRLSQLLRGKCSAPRSRRRRTNRERPFHRPFPRRGALAAGR